MVSWRATGASDRPRTMRQPGSSRGQPLRQRGSRQLRRPAHVKGAVGVGVDLRRCLDAALPDGERACLGARAEVALAARRLPLGKRAGWVGLEWEAGRQAGRGAPRAVRYLPAWELTRTGQTSAACPHTAPRGERTWARWMKAFACSSVWVGCSWARAAVHVARSTRSARCTGRHRRPNMVFGLCLFRGGSKAGQGASMRR